MSVWACGQCGTKYAVGAPRCPQCSANEPVTEPAVSPLASLTVACLPGDGCRYAGVKRRVMLPQIVPGVIDMPHLHCAGCGNELFRIEEGADVPKITVHGGATNAATDAEGGEESSPTPEAPGTSSPTSSAKEPNSPKTNDSEDPSPAPTTGSRSRRARTGSSSAKSTGGGQTAATSDTDN
jgi:hypothetical protein